MADGQVKGAPEGGKPKSDTGVKGGKDTGKKGLDTGKKGLDKGKAGTETPKVGGNG